MLSAGLLSKEELRQFGRPQPALGANQISVAEGDGGRASDQEGEGNGIGEDEDASDGGGGGLLLPVCHTTVTVPNTAQRVQGMFST